MFFGCVCRSEKGCEFPDLDVLQPGEHGGGPLSRVRLRDPRRGHVREEVLTTTVSVEWNALTSPHNALKQLGVRHHSVTGTEQHCWPATVEGGHEGVMQAG